jgi:hypothetical protein
MQVWRYATQGYAAALWQLAVPQHGAGQSDGELLKKVRVRLRHGHPRAESRHNRFVTLNDCSCSALFSRSPCMTVMRS